MLERADSTWRVARGRARPAPHHSQLHHLLHRGGRPGRRVGRGHPHRRGPCRSPPPPRPRLHRPVERELRRAAAGARSAPTSTSSWPARALDRHGRPLLLRHLRVRPADPHPVSDQVGHRAGQALGRRHCALNVCVPRIRADRRRTRCGLLAVEIAPVRVSAAPVARQGRAVVRVAVGHPASPCTKTLARADPGAQARAAQVSASRDVDVVLADGTYALTAPLRFSSADGGRNGHQVVYEAAAAATPALSGGTTSRTVTNRRRHRAPGRRQCLRAPPAAELYVNVRAGPSVRGDPRTVARGCRPTPATTDH